jgi:hypothetical protein
MHHNKPKVTMMTGAVGNGLPIGGVRCVLKGILPRGTPASGAPSRSRQATGQLKRPANAGLWNDKGQLPLQILNKGRASRGTRRRPEPWPGTRQRTPAMGTPRTVAGNPARSGLGTSSKQRRRQDHNGGTGKARVTACGIGGAARSGSGGHQRPGHAGGWAKAERFREIPISEKKKMTPQALQQTDRAMARAQPEGGASESAPWGALWAIPEHFSGTLGALLDRFGELRNHRVSTP